MASLSLGTHRIASSSKAHTLQRTKTIRYIAGLTGRQRLISILISDRTDSCWHRPASFIDRSVIFVARFAYVAAVVCRRQRQLGASATVQKHCCHIKQPMLSFLTFYALSTSVFITEQLNWGCRFPEEAYSQKSQRYGHILRQTFDTPWLECWWWGAHPSMPPPTPIVLPKLNQKRQRTYRISGLIQIRIRVCAELLQKYSGIHALVANFHLNSRRPYENC